MKKHETCPVCAGSATKKIADRCVQVVEPPPNIQQASINAVLRHVLACDSLTTETLLCRRCRHIYLSPTFEEAELDRLYSPECLVATKRQYRESERATGKSWAEQHGICPADQEVLLAASRRYRPKRLHELVTGVTGHDQFGAVLDFGAHTGELTEHFAESRRYVFDKDLSSVSDNAVIALASLQEIALNGPYDLLVLSHVLEHIPYPTKLLELLRTSTTPGGFLYVEVPLEYCGTIIKRRGIPIGGHVNYFSRSSLLYCLRSAGFGSVATILREIAPYGECQLPVIKSVAKANVGNRFSPRPLPWPVDLLIDTVLTVRSRGSAVRFG